MDLVKSEFKQEHEIVVHDIVANARVNAPLNPQRLLSIGRHRITSQVLCPLVAQVRHFPCRTDVPCLALIHQRIGGDGVCVVQVLVDVDKQVEILTKLAFFNGVARQLGLGQPVLQVACPTHLDGQFAIEQFPGGGLEILENPIGLWLDHYPQRSG